MQISRDCLQSFYFMFESFNIGFQLLITFEAKSWRAFGTLHCQPAIEFISCKTFQISPNSPLDFSLCYLLGFFHVSTISYFKLPFLSSTVKMILEEFGIIVTLMIFCLGYSLYVMFDTSNLLLK